MNIRDILFFLRNPQGSRLPQQVQKLKDSSEDLQDQIIPWSQDELELISFQLSNLSSKRLDRARDWKGIITSIFHEYLFSIVVKKLNRSGTNSIVLIRNSKTEWVYRIKDKGAVVYVNGQGAAKIMSDGRMLPFKGSGQLGKLNFVNYGNASISIKGKAIGEINKFERGSAFNQRALTLIHNFEDEGESLLFLTLVLYRLSTVYIEL